MIVESRNQNCVEKVHDSWRPQVMVAQAAPKHFFANGCLLLSTACLLHFDSSSRPPAQTKVGCGGHKCHEGVAVAADYW